MTRNRYLAAALSALALIPAACGEPHVQLESPGRGAPLVERQKSYERLRPAGTSQRVIVTTSDASGSSSTHTSIILSNGETVHHAEDVLPVVPADSPTAEAARRHAYHRRWDSVGWTLSTMGVLVALGSIVIPVVNELDEPNPSPDIWWPGVIGGVVGVVVGSGIAYYHGRRARDSKIAAFATYDESLRAHLDICVEGTRLFDCGEGLPAPPPGEPPPPPPSGAPLDCSPAGSFQLELRYQGGCTGPARLKIRHDPKMPRRIDLAAGSFDAKKEALDTVAFEPQGCHAELVYRGKGGELRFTFDGTTAGRVEGQGALAAAGGTSCPVDVTGTFAAR